MAKTSLSGFIRSQWTTVPPVETVDLTGQTVIVIGASAGIGYEASKHFANMNPGKLILGCRSREKGEKAVARLQQETGYERAEVWLIDLAQFSSVIAFADRFIKEGGRLDLLVENAAVIAQTFLATSDGWEETLQVNDLALSLLAILLLPRMLETAKKHSTIPRLVLVSSEMHFTSQLNESLIKSDNPLRTFGSKDYCTAKEMKSRYKDSKLLNVFFIRALNNHLRQSPIIVNTVNPGYCYSELRRSFFGITAFGHWVLELLLARTSEEGARQLVWAAVGGADEPERLRGAYISLANVEEPSDYVISKEGQNTEGVLWKNLINELVKIDSRVRSIVDEYL